MSRNQRTISVLSAIAVLFSLAGCPAKTVSGASYAPSTTMKLSASARCSASGACRCRPLDGEVKPEKGIAAGHKRFELRLPRTLSAIWVEIGDRGVYYKSPTPLKAACFYVDLPPGEYEITVHSEKRDPEIGLQTGLTMYEYGPKASAWYRSLHFVCGTVGDNCTKMGLKSWAAFQRKQPRGVLDPCGSVMVRGATFGGKHGGRGADEYEEVTVHMTMKVYEFETYRAPKSPGCKAPIKNR